MGLNCGSTCSAAPTLVILQSTLETPGQGSSVGRAPSIYPVGPGFKPQSGHFYVFEIDNVKSICNSVKRMKSDN
jgi:hypothetical protein